MSYYKLWLHAKDFNIVGFYPYTSSVSHRILEQNHNHKTDEHDFLEKFWNAMWEKAEKLGCQFDNKIVLEIEPSFKTPKDFSKNSNLFIGKYDGKIALGFGIWQPDSWTHERNQYFTKQSEQDLASIADSQYNPEQ